MHTKRKPSRPGATHVREATDAVIRTLLLPPPYWSLASFACVEDLVTVVFLLSSFPSLRARVLALSLSHLIYIYTHI